MSEITIEAIGIAAGTLTTICWVPQAVKMLREKNGAGLSLVMQSAFTAGVLLWFIYGVALGRPSIMLANGVTLAFSAAILMLKLRYG